MTFADFWAALVSEFNETKNRNLTLLFAFLSGVFITLIAVMISFMIMVSSVHAADGDTTPGKSTSEMANALICSGVIHALIEVTTREDDDITYNEQKLLDELNEAQAYWDEQKNVVSMMFANTPPSRDDISFNLVTRYELGIDQISNGAAICFDAIKE